MTALSDKQLLGMVDDDFRNVMSPSTEKIMVRQLRRASDAARQAALEEAAKIADCAVPTGPDPIGPLRSAGIHTCAKWIGDSIRALAQKNPGEGGSIASHHGEKGPASDPAPVCSPQDTGSGCKFCDKGSQTEEFRGAPHHPFMTGNVQSFWPCTKRPAVEVGPNFSGPLTNCYECTGPLNGPYCPKCSPLVQVIDDAMVERALDRYFSPPPPKHVDWRNDKTYYYACMRRALSAALNVPVEGKEIPLPPEWPAPDWRSKPITAGMMVDVLRGMERSFGRNDTQEGYAFKCFADALTRAAKEK